MPSELLTVNAIAKLTPVLTTVTGIVPQHVMRLAPSGPFASSEGRELLLESDIDASFASYTSAYVNGPYSVMGALRYQGLKSIAGLSALTKKGDAPVALKKTTGIITCQVTLPAQTPPPTSSGDLIPSYDIRFEFVFAGQTLASSD